MRICRFKLLYTFAISFNRFSGSPCIEPPKRYRKRIQKFETTNCQKKLLVGIQIVVFRQITPEKDTQPIHKSIGPQVNLRNPNIYQSGRDGASSIGVPSIRSFLRIDRFKLSLLYTFATCPLTGVLVHLVAWNLPPCAGRRYSSS